MTRIFPIAMIAGDIGAAIVYAFSGDARRAIYWFSAAVLTASVTF